MMRIFSLAAVLLPLVVAGCKTPPAAPVVVECSAMDAKREHPQGTALVGGQYGVVENTPIPLDAVQFTDAWLAKHVAVQGLYTEKTATDTVQVSARLVNCGDKTLSVSTRVSFLKESQAPAEPVSAWRSIMLAPRATALYQENSISREVAHYLIEIRPNVQGQSPGSGTTHPSGPL